MQNKGEPVKVGVTGGIGAGKSIICRIFSKFSIPVYNADERAHYLMNNDPAIISEIKKIFSDQSYQEGKLDRKYIAGMVFNNDARLTALNEIIHPAVKVDFENWVNDKTGAGVIIKEAALLYETGTYRDLDRTILVYCPLEIRIKRTLLRDPHRTRADIERIVEKQMSDNEKKKLADFLIINDDMQPVMPQVREILEVITHL